MPDGYCTVEDVRRVLQDAEFDQALSANSNQVVVDAIASQTEWLQEVTNRHWYESGGVTEDDEGLIPSSARTHTEDEQDLPTRPFLTTERRVKRKNIWVSRNRGTDPAPEGGLDIRTFRGDYTRITLFRRDITSLTELLVLHDTNGYEDWVADSSKTEGKSDDYYLHVNDSTGLTRLYLDTDSIDEDLSDFGSAVIATYEYGIDGIPTTVRRGVAFLAASQLVMDDEFRASIPDSGQLVNVETKAQAWQRKAEDLLSIHMLDPGDSSD